MKKAYILFTFLFLFSGTLISQMHPDRHNTNWFDAWTSCTSSPSPNEIRGEIHWIMYDLGHTYPLTELTIWNANVPDSTDLGLQNIVIDYSADAVDWIEFGSYTLNESPGSSVYEGEEVMDFNGTLVRYLLINVLSTHGSNCASFAEMRVNIGEATVPVELVNFDVKCQGKFAQLEWTTANEINNDFFEVQRSKDGINWSPLNQIAAKANGESTNEYGHLDRSIGNELSYYRLVQVDTDGSRNIHPVKSVQCAYSDQDVALTPNPAQTKTTLFLSSDEMNIQSIELYGIGGERIKSFPNSQGNEIALDLQDLASGNYIILITTLDESIRKELIVID